MRPAPPSGPRRPGPAPPAPGGAGRRGTTRTRRGPPSPGPLTSPRHESLTTSVIKRTPGVNTRKEICQLCDIYDGARPARTDTLRRTQTHGDRPLPPREAPGAGTTPPRRPSPDTSPPPRPERRSGRSRTRWPCPSPRAASPSGPPGRRRVPGRGRWSLPRRRAAARGPVAGVGHLHADRADAGLRRDTRQQHAQNGRTAGVHHGVGDELGDDQDERLRQWLIGLHPGPCEARARPPAGSPHLRGIRPDLQLNLKHLHRSHHPNRRTHRLGTVTSQGAHGP